MKIRRVISLTALLSFAFLALSGVMLFLSPQGRVAYWSGWTLFGLTKEEYSAVHTTFMVLFLAVGIWHIVLNWKPITGYLKNRSKQIRVFTPESSVALGVALLFLIGPLAGLPPFEQFLDAGIEVKDYWEATSGSPPWGHAEENSLQRFCRGMEDFERLESQRLVSIDCQEALQALRAEGLAVEGLGQRLVDIADANGTTPQAIAAVVMEVARPLTPQEAATALIPVVEEVRYQRPYSGLGRLTLKEYAVEYGYDLEEIRAILSVAGFTVDPDARLREEALRLGTDPEGLIEVLNGGKAEGPGNP
ncbi:MAG: DUF4405 domain-containing protein [Longimicrobiales bacterium]